MYVDSVSLWFKDVLRLNIDDDILGSSAALNIEDMGAFETIVKKLLSHRVEIVRDVNSSLFHAIVDGLFLLKGVSHRQSPDNNATQLGLGSDGMTSVYYPIRGQSTKIIIHDYHILGNTDSAQVDRVIHDAFWQVYEHNSLKDVVLRCKELNYPQYYQQVEIRVFVAFINENTPNLPGIFSTP